MSVELCENCTEKIGALEEAHLWKGKVVCSACRTKLAHSSQGAPPQLPTSSAVQADDPLMELARLQSENAPLAALAPPAPISLNHGDIVCPNPRCGYVGAPRKEKWANTGCGCLLMFFFLLPGILYFLFKSGYRYVCPVCGLMIRSDA
jgi:hypothetical protein